MSYDISFRVRVADTDKFVEVGHCDANITWNVRQIIELSTGLPWLNEQNNGYCVDIMPAIQKGLSELRAHPEKYKQYEAENGWARFRGRPGSLPKSLKTGKNTADGKTPRSLRKRHFGWYSDARLLCCL